MISKEVKASKAVKRVKLSFRFWRTSSESEEREKMKRLGKPLSTPTPNSHRDISLPYSNLLENTPVAKERWFSFISPLSAANALEIKNNTQNAKMIIFFMPTL